VSVNVAYIITSLNRGGAEAALYSLLKGRESLRSRAIVISLSSGGIFQERIKKLGVEVRSLGMGIRIPNPYALLQLRKLIQHYQPTLCHGWMYHGIFAALLASGRRPLVASVHHALHDLQGERFRTRQLIFALARASRRMDRIIYCAEASRRQHEAIGYDPTKSVVLPNGFDCSWLRPVPDARSWLRSTLKLPAEAKIIGHLGRYHSVKNHVGLLESFARISSRYPSAHLAMAGAGVDGSNHILRSAIGRLGLEGRAHLLGERDDVPELLSGFDILANASHSEAFPNVLGEAMACAVPCVATDVGDSAAIIGETGLVAPPRDPEALATALSVLLDESGDALSARGQAARALILQKFELSVVTKRQLRLYDEILQESCDSD